MASGLDWFIITGKDGKPLSTGVQHYVIARAYVSGDDRSLTREGTGEK